MKKDTLIWKIINKLHDEGALELSNYVNYIEQANDIHDIIEKILIDYVIIEGVVVE